MYSHFSGKLSLYYISMYRVQWNDCYDCHVLQYHSYNQGQGVDSLVTIIVNSPSSCPSLLSYNTSLSMTLCSQVKNILPGEIKILIIKFQKKKYRISHAHQGSIVDSGPGTWHA